MAKPSALHRILVLASAFLLILSNAACTSNSNQGNALGAENPTSQKEIVQPELEEANQVVQTIGADGGALTATGFDGVVYTLTIPTGALRKDIEVRLTPIRSLKGIELSGGLIGAVDIQPEGQMLLEPATLVIKSSAPFDPGRFVSFNYQGKAQTLGLYPMETKGSELTAQLIHFSGYGAGMANALEYQKLIDSTQTADQPPSNASSESGLPTDKNDPANSMSGSAQSYVNEISQAMTDAVRSGQKPESANAKVQDALRRWFDQILRPRMMKVQDDEHEFYGAMFDFFAWGAFTMTLGRDNASSVADLLKEGGQLLGQASIQAADRTLAKCSGENVLDQAGVILGWSERMSLVEEFVKTVGVFPDKSSYSAGDRRAVETKAGQCVNLTLSMDSTAEWQIGDDSGGYKLQSNASAEVALGQWQYFSNDAEFLGAEASASSYSISQTEGEFYGSSAEMNQLCTWVIPSGGTAAMRVSDVSFNVIKGGMLEMPERLELNEVRIIPGIPTPADSLKLDCESSYGDWTTATFPPIITVWYNGFAATNKDISGETSEGGAYFSLTDWQNGDAGVVLHKVLNKETDLEGSVLRSWTTFDLVH